MVKVFYIALLFLLPVVAPAQSVLLKGIVRDVNGERLPQAHILFAPDTLHLNGENNGSFAVKRKPGLINVTISYTGYNTFQTTIFLRQDTTITFSMASNAQQLKEITVTASRYKQSDILQTTRMSSITLSEKEITSIPVLGGEADLIKVLQLLPGTSKGVEGSTDLFVRGGAADQNLVLLDGAPVYNTGHLFGFLSVFNSDILENVEAMNGAFPAEYGGRLSSILDVRTKSNFQEKTSVQGNIGLLASRLKIEQPLVKNKLSIWAAARRTYIDQVIKVVGEELPYYFYDINAKVNYRPTPNNQIDFSIFSGKDILDFNGLTARQRRQKNSNTKSNFDIGNSTQSLRWNNRTRQSTNSTLILTRSVFNYSIFNRFEDSELFVKSNIEDLGAKWIINTDSLKHYAVKTGIEFMHHAVSPNIISTSGELSELLESSATKKQECIETSAFIQLDGDIRTAWRWSAGLRLSSAIVSKRTYLNPEPRLALRYSLSKQTTLKTSYSRMAQYLHRVSSAAVAFPTDIWYPVTKNVVPQTANQYSVALHHVIPKANLFISLEGYYKKLNQLVGYQEGTNLLLNTDFESQLIQGNGRAYGVEVLVKKEAGKLSGWISYTLSWSQRQYSQVNNGEWFFSRYDRRHNGALVVNYQLGKRLSFSGVWEFISGSRFTPIIGQYVAPSPSMGGFNLVPIYASVNSVKLADTHRLDLGIKYRSKPRRNFQGEWFVGVYNTYNRATPIGIFIESDDQGLYRYVQPGLFGLLPFISYGFKF